MAMHIICMHNEVLCRCRHIILRWPEFISMTWEDRRHCQHQAKEDLLPHVCTFEHAFET